MCFVIVRSQEMGVVRCDERHPHFTVKPNQSVVDSGLSIDAMALDFQVIVFAEDVEKFFHCGHRGGHALALDEMRDLTAQASRQTDQTLRVFPQQFLVDSGMIVKPFHVAGRDQLYQVVVPACVLRQKHQMV